MKDQDKTQKQLIKELTQLRQRVADMEQSEIKHKQAEEELKTNYVRLNYLLISIPAAIYTSKVSGNYGATSITDNVKEITGYEPREFTDSSSFWIDHVHPEDKQRILKELPSVFKKGSHTYEYRFQHKDGHYIWMRDEMRLMKDASPKPIEIVGYWIDITESKQMQETLRGNEQKYRKLVELTKTGYLILDSRGAVIDANPEYVRLTGHRTLAEIIGRNVVEWTAEYEKEKNAKAVQECLRLGYVNNLEIDYVDRQGRITPIEINAFMEGQGEASRIVSLCRDITERKRAEEALRESEEKYRSLTDNVNVGVYRNTVGPKGKFIEANPALVSMFGFQSREKLFARSVADLYQYPEGRKAFNEKITKEGFVRYEELLLKKKDGTSFWGSISAVAVKDEDGRIKYYDGIIEDITERKKAEEKLKERMEELLAWENLTLGREGRIMELKKEVNELLTELGKPARYGDEEEGPPYPPPENENSH